MSRTGVGCRVVIDGKQIDDGCFVWAQESPGTVLRTNDETNPRAALATTDFGASVATGSAALSLQAVSGLTAPLPATFIRATVTVAGNTYIQISRNMRGLTPGQVVSLSAYGRSSLAYTSSQVLITLHDAANAQLGATISVPGPAGSAGQWLRWTAPNITLPANVSYAVFRIRIIATTVPVGATIDITGILRERASSVRVYIDGAIADTDTREYLWSGQPDKSTSIERVPLYSERLAEGLSADEGLRVVWGRTNTNEQPSPSTCTFTVTDDPGNLYFANLRIGSSVYVYADSTVHGGSTLPAFHDPDFESEVRATPSNATVTRDNRHVETGTMAALMKPLVFDRTYSAQFPPGTLQPSGTNPNAWDDIPHLSPGQTWHLAVRVWVPDGVTVTAKPVIYTGPYAGAATVLPAMGSASVAGWNTIEADVSPGVALGWMGVQIEASGGGTWGDTDPAIEWAQLPDTLEWRDFSDVYIDRVGVFAPEGGTTVTMLVFGGRVTDLDSSWNGSGPQIAITAVDFLGDLGNRYVGDEPWLLEPLATRVARVLNLARAGNEPPITADVATTIANVPVTWEDVDHRAASGLLTDLAQSVDGVLWSATHIVSGPYVKIEDPGQRPPLYQLAIDAGKIVIASIDVESLPVDQRPLDLSACDVLRDPVTFTLDVADIATRAVVSWQEQTLNEEGLPSPTERNYSEILANREAQYGTRNISVTTLLTTQAAAETVAERLLARNTGQWRMEGLEVADLDFTVPDDRAAQILLALLDGVRRGGLPVRVTELPTWSPIGETAPAYVEGGDYTFSGGGWTLALTISRATGLGANATWDEIPRDPAWIWDTWSPSITWDALRGVAGPEKDLARPAPPDRPDNTIPEES